MRQRRQPEIIAGRVAADGTLSSCTDDRTHTSKSATGIWVIYFPDSFRVVSVSVNCNQANNYVMSASLGSGLVQVDAFASTTAARTDVPFTFTAVGVQQ